MRMSDWSSDVCSADLVHGRVAGYDIEHALHGGQGTAGEDVALDEVDAAARLFVALVANGDGLQQHQPVVLEQPRALSEVSRQEVVADRFDHFDGHQLVELTVEIAIRSEEHTSELQSLMRTSYAVFCLK